MKLLAFIAALAVSLSTSAEVLPRFTQADRVTRLREAFPSADIAVQKWWTVRGSPGLIYGVVIDGKLAHVRAWGVRDVASKQPVTPATAFRIASMTKSFTALAILKLRDAGKLSLDDAAERWIPQFAKLSRATADSPSITVRDLLTHSAGFPEDNPWGDQQLGIPDKQVDAWLDSGVPSPLPREQRMSTRIMVLRCWAELSRGRRACRTTNISSERSWSRWG